MKKKIIIFGITVFLGLGLSSCADYLDVQRYFVDRQDLERIFNSRDYTEEWLANAYYELLNFNLEIGHTRFAITNFSDDLTYIENAGLTYSAFKFGQYGPQYSAGSNLISQPWRQSYAGIRQASIMIQRVHPGSEITEAVYRDLKGQAYFVRGYFYWLLLRKYGPVPILPEEGLDYEDSYDDLARPRNSYDECVEYISKQMLLAAELLPDKRTALDASRPTKGSALATRAKAYLYAASPLMNGNTEMADFVDDTGRILISQEYDEGKWAKAAAAALDVIKTGNYKLHTVARRSGSSYNSGAYPATLAPPYHPVYSEKDWPEGWKNIDPLESYRTLFNGDLYVSDNSELIFSRGSNQTANEWGILSMTMHQMPQGFGSNGYNCHGITGKMCDTYAMDTGETFERTEEMKGFTTAADIGTVQAPGPMPNLKLDVWKEYGKREPRFYASVAFSGSNWPASTAIVANQDQQVFYYYGEQNGRVAVSTSARWLPTGIGFRKFVNPKDSNNGGQLFPKVDPSIRYTDILLMYVEALNELTQQHEVLSWDGQTTYNLFRDVDEMKKHILPIRIRAGLPNYHEIPGMADPYGSAAALKAQIKRERMIEFVGENQRYFDLRRWMDAPTEEGAPVKGCNTTVRKENAALFYEQVEVPSIQTSFSKKQYFWPIAWEELRRNARLTQAPGWPSFD